MRSPPTQDQGMPERDFLINATGYYRNLYEQRPLSGREYATWDAFESRLEEIDPLPPKPDVIWGELPL